MLYLLTGTIVIMLLLIVIVIETSQRLGYLKSRCVDDRVHWDNRYYEHSKRLIKLEADIVELNRVLFVMVDSPNTRNFQERVSIATILGAVMGELGLSIQCKKLKITKKGDQGYGKEGTETNRGGSKEKQSGRVHQ